MFSWVKNFFRKKNKQVFEDDEAQNLSIPSEESSINDQIDRYFSTHMGLGQNITFDELGRLQDAAFQVRPENILNDSGETGMDSQAAKSAFSVSSRVPQGLLEWFVSHGFIGYQACALIAQQWLVDKACGLKGEDAVRKWYSVSLNDGIAAKTEVIAAIKKADRKLKLRNHLTQAHKFKEVFGIRHILFVVESADEDYYEKPFNLDGIKPGSYKGITQIDPYWITPLLDSSAVADPESQNFYEPTYWVISGKKYHRSHFVILRGPEVSDILKPSYLYGGIPLTQRIMERIYAAERTANEAPELAMTKRLYVRYMDLDKMLSKQFEFSQILAEQAKLKNNHGFLAAGENERVEALETSLSDLDSLIMTQYQLVAAVARIPATKLLGTSPKGFQSTGEHEINTYHEELETVQSCLLEIVEKHHGCVMRSIINPKFKLGDFSIEVVWNPLDVPTAKEQKETQEIDARTDELRISSGVVDAYEVRDKLIKNPNSGYDGLESISRPDESEEGL